MSLPRNFLEVDGHPWAYLEFGQGETLVMLHGWLTNADFLVPIANALSSKFRVIVIDLPGFGFTTALSKNDYKNITQGIIGFLQVLNIKKANFFGASMGAAILLELAVTKPAIIKTLFLQSPPWEKGGIKKNLIERIELSLVKLPNKMLRFVQKPDIFKLMLGLASFIRSDLKGLLKSRENSVLKLVDSLDPESIKQMADSIFNPDFTSKLCKLKVRPILISGVNDQVITPREMDKLAKYLPYDHCVFVAKQDHEMTIDAPEKISKIVWEWVMEKRLAQDPDFTWTSH